MADDKENKLPPPIRLPPNPDDDINGYYIESGWNGNEILYRWVTPRELGLPEGGPVNRQLYRPDGSLTRRGANMALKGKLPRPPTPIYRGSDNRWTNALNKAILEGEND